MGAISFKGRHFQQDLILQSVRWYLAYALSYRDIEELMQERGFSVDHSTINRWGQVNLRSRFKLSWTQIDLPPVVSARSTADLNLGRFV